MAMDTEKIVYLLIGFVFGLLPRIAESRDKESLQKKRALTKLRRILEDLFIEMEVTPLLRDAGAIQTMEGCFDLDESWAWRIPVSPPSGSTDFQKVIDEVLEWETMSGNYSVSKQIISIKCQLENAQSLYQALASLAKVNQDIPERPIAIYTSELNELKKSCSTLLNEVDSLRTPFHRKLLPRWKHRKSKLPSHAT